MAAAHDPTRPGPSFPGIFQRGRCGPGRSDRISGRIRQLPLLLAFAAAIAVAAATTAAARGTEATVWLCRPGQAGNPCTAPLDVTVVLGDGSRSVRHVEADPSSRFDCFYVYPTVSRERTANSDLRIQLAETGTAVSQASRFSQVCRVWAPMYRQRTLTSLAAGRGGDPDATAVAYRSLLAGWHDYLAHENHGRPIVFVGHSQGARMITMLLRDELDTNPALRRRLVSAILLGGNVTVARGKDVGGSFRHIPACRSAIQVGCVIAYSSFPGPPPPDSVFGRPGRGIGGRPVPGTADGEQVLCVNPAALSGGAGPLDPYFPSFGSAPPGPPVTTPWVEYPGLYAARCRSEGGATWLQVTDVGRPGDDRPRVTERLGPRSGFHVDDVNLALGNLVRDVRLEEAAYLRRPA